MRVRKIIMRRSVLLALLFASTFASAQTDRGPQGQVFVPGVEMPRLWAPGKPRTHANAQKRVKTMLKTRS